MFDGAIVVNDNERGRNSLATAGHVPDLFARFNRRWLNGKTLRPVVVLIGGNIGTGKSTFAQELTDRLASTNLLPTGLVRSILQSMYSEAKHPELFRHSYQLIELAEDHSDELGIALFSSQAAMIQAALERIISFAFSEGQNWIIEGNHVTAGFILKMREQFPVIGLGLRVSDERRYKKLVSGPTHHRRLTRRQHEFTRTVHDHLVKEFEEHSIPLFEYTETQTALAYVATEVDLEVVGS